jgi:hypothetical protein
MTTLARIKNHLALAEATLTSRYKEAPNTLALLRAITRRVQELEEAIWDVIEGRLLISKPGIQVPWEGQAGADVLIDAQGVQLDMLGRLVGLERLGRLDAPFAAAIRLQLRIARSSGTPNDLIEIGLLSYPGAQVVYRDEIAAGTSGILPATARISVSPTDGSIGPLLRRAKPAGVRLEIVQGVNATNAFRWGSSTGGVTAGRHTWGNVGGIEADSRWGTGENS